MKYAELVDLCDEQVNLCGKCDYKKECMGLQRNGIPKPYQYKGITGASILKKNVEDLLKQNRSL